MRALLDRPPRKKAGTALWGMPADPRERDAEPLLLDIVLAQAVEGLLMEKAAVPSTRVDQAGEPKRWKARAMFRSRSASWTKRWAYLGPG